MKRQLATLMALLLTCTILLCGGGYAENDPVEDEWIWPEPPKDEQVPLSEPEETEETEMANNIIKRTWKQNGLVKIEDLSGQVFQNESGGHTFVIRGEDEDGNQIALSGSPAGVFLRPDNTDQALTCSISDGMVYATLPAACYDVPGRAGITIYLTSGGQKTALYAAMVSVGRTSTGTVAPGTTADVVDLINRINEVVATIPPDYSALSNEVVGLESTLLNNSNILLNGGDVYPFGAESIPATGATIDPTNRTIVIENGSSGEGAGLIVKTKAPKDIPAGSKYIVSMIWETNAYNYFRHAFGLYGEFNYTPSKSTFSNISEDRWLVTFEFTVSVEVKRHQTIAYRMTKNPYAYSGTLQMSINEFVIRIETLENFEYNLSNNVIKNTPVISNIQDIPVNNFDNFPVNNSYLIAVGGVTSEVIANAPFYPFQGFVTTIGRDEINNIKDQYAVGTNGNIYHRTMWGSWGSWSNITEDKSNTFEYLENGLFSTFTKVGCIGDSLASGECYSDETGTPKGHDLYQFSWGQFMARMSGNTYYNFSNGGLTTRTFLTERWMNVALDGDHDCDCYIIGLGVNDAGSTYHVDIGTSSDINLSDYTQNADTFYGNYGKIIQMLKEHNPKVHFFVLTNPLSNNEYNTAIRTIAGMFTNVHLLDLYTDYRQFFTSGSFVYQNERWGHYNATAYCYIARIIANAMCKIMYNNPGDFEQVEFILTDYSWTD